MSLATPAEKSDTLTTAKKLQHLSQIGKDSRAAAERILNYPALTLASTVS